MAHYNSHITGWQNPLYTANNQGFGLCSFQLSCMINDCTWNLIRSFFWQQEIKALSNRKHSDHGKETLTMKLDRQIDGQFFPYNIHT